MLPFAHIGITLALFYITTKGRNINYWYVVIGSILPDLIDKFIGRVLFADTFASGRIFAHSLLFVVVLGLAGYYLYMRRKDTRLLILAAASTVHLLLDSIWQSPQTFLWPLLGWEFGRGTQYGSFWQYLSTAYGRILDGSLSLGLTAEIIGLIIILIFTAAKLRQRLHTS